MRSLSGGVACNCRAVPTFTEISKSDSGVAFSFDDADLFGAVVYEGVPGSLRPRRGLLVNCGFDWERMGIVGN